MTSISYARTACILLAVGCFGFPTGADANPAGPSLYEEATILGEVTDDRPLSSVPDYAAGTADTLSFGFIDADGFAIEGDMWTWDHGLANRRGGLEFEGWAEEDLTEQSDAIAFFRRVTPDIWIDGGNLPLVPVPAPILAGTASMWCGFFKNEADAEGWVGELGYGNNWNQLLESPVLNYNGAGDVDVSFEFFTDLEPGFDHIHLAVQTLPSGTVTLLTSFTGQAGLAGDHPVSSPTGVPHNDLIPEAWFGTDGQYRIFFNITSDGGGSDEDGLYDTAYGPFGLDDITIDDTTFDFEEDMQGWTQMSVPGVGTFMGIRDVAEYVIEDLCDCALSGNVLELHDENNEHPLGQHTAAFSNPVDVLNDVFLPGTGSLEIFFDWTQYSILPQANGVFYRPQFNYFPYINPNNGDSVWSGPVGQNTFLSIGPDPICAEHRSIATDNGIPPNVEQIEFVYELYASCDVFGIPPEECSGVTNFTPVLDNARMRFTRVPAAPRISYDAGGRFQDGFSQSLLMDPNQPGNADVTINVNLGNETPIILGDSLSVSGPVPSPGFEYDTRLWFRIARKGPGTNTAGYNAWRTRVQQDGGIDAVDSTTDIELGEFATAKMDSFQVGVDPTSNRFVSYFIEEDARFDGGSGELSEANEIIADGRLLPGTQVQYFVSSSYIDTPNELFTLPDTSGGFFDEFEILPNWRDDNGTFKFPCLLYIDAYNRGAQGIIEGAFSALGLEVDRYDYLDPSSSWKAPMAQGLSSGANNGCSTFQLLSYRGILLSTGTLSGNTLWPNDFLMLSDWLTTFSCDADESRQGLVMNGDNMGTILSSIVGSVPLEELLGAQVTASAYNQEGGVPDESYCVQLESPTVGSFSYGTTNSSGNYAYDAFGNWCPQKFTFDVLSPVGSGVGNRAYVNVLNFEETNYAQITNESSPGIDNYRTILDGVSWHHLSERDVIEECVSDSAHIVTAASNEILAALEWAFGVGAIPSLCEDIYCFPAGVPGDEVDYDARDTRLFQNSPNPFNPYTTLRFSLAANGPVELIIYDVNGRRVRTLIDGVLEAGSHEVVWDGTNDAGRELTSGVYWSQFEALGQKSNKKMVLLRR